MHNNTSSNLFGPFMRYFFLSTIHITRYVTLHKWGESPNGVLSQIFLSHTIRSVAPWFEIYHIFLSLCKCQVRDLNPCREVLIYVVLHHKENKDMACLSLVVNLYAVHGNLRNVFIISHQKSARVVTIEQIADWIKYTRRFP